MPLPGQQSVSLTINKVQVQAGCQLDMAAPAEQASSPQAGASSHAVAGAELHTGLASAASGVSFN